MLHWDGTNWKYVPANAQHSYNGLASSSDKDVWAVGGPFVEHWNGTGKKTPAAYVKGGLQAVSAVSPHDAWGVGATDDVGGHALAEHWNGTRWNPTVLDTRPDAMLTAVKALTPKEVWAVGSTDATDRSLIAHYSC